MLYRTPLRPMMCFLALPLVMTRVEDSFYVYIRASECSAMVTAEPGMLLHDVKLHRVVALPDEIDIASFVPTPNGQFNDC